MTAAFNPPPDWPEPPRDGWTPPAGWRPEPDWGRVPAGWRLWVDQNAPTQADAPLMASEDVPASGARIRTRSAEPYPVTVLNPGMWSENHLEQEDYGFPAPPETRQRPRLRLAMTILATVIGLLLAVAAVILFVQLTQYATDRLPAAVGIDGAVVVAMDPAPAGAHGPGIAGNTTAL